MVSPDAKGGLRRKDTFVRREASLIRHAPHSGTVTATSLGVHCATARGCLIASASFPLPVAAGFLGTGSHAVNLASVAPPTDKNLTMETSTEKNPARYFINTCVGACQTLAILVLCVGKFQQYWALRELVSTLGHSDICNDWLSRPAHPLFARFWLGRELP